MTGRRGWWQRSLGRWRGLWSGVGSQRGCIGTGRVRGGRTAVITAHASAYVAIGRLALCMHLRHGGHRWHWGCWLLLLLLLLLLLRASHTAISRHFLGRRSRRLCYVACHAVRQLRICVPECVVCKGLDGALVAAQSPMNVVKVVRCSEMQRGKVQAGKRLLFNKLYQTPRQRRIASYATHFQERASGGSTCRPKITGPLFSR